MLALEACKTILNNTYHLPSSLNAPIRASVTLYQHEFKFREAQAYEALEELRQHLRLRTHMFKFKDKNLRGQGANTRAGNLLKDTHKKVNVSATKYRRARTALQALSRITGNVGWDIHLKLLQDEDIREFTDGVDGETIAQKKRRLKRGGRSQKALLDMDDCRCLGGRRQYWTTGM